MLGAKATTTPCRLHVAFHAALIMLRPIRIFGLDFSAKVTAQHGTGRPLTSDKIICFFIAITSTNTVVFSRFEIHSDANLQPVCLAVQLFLMWLVKRASFALRDFPYSCFWSLKRFISRFLHRGARAEAFTK